MRSSFGSRVLIAAIGSALVAGMALASPVAASPSHQLRPGAMVHIADVKCTLGVLLHQGKTVYAGVPASCGALPLSEGQPQWGCGEKGNRQTAASAPVGTPVHITGAQHRGILVYDSFTRMQFTGVERNNPCQFNELILIKLSAADANAARNAATHVAATPPHAGTSLSIGGASAKAAAATHGGWVIPLSNAPTLNKVQVGTPVTHGKSLVGMLTALSQGALTKTPPATYNLYRAIAYAKRAPCVKKYKACFNHLALLKS